MAANEINLMGDK